MYIILNYKLISISFQTFYIVIYFVSPKVIPISLEPCSKFQTPLSPNVKCIFLHPICFDKDNEYVSMSRNKFSYELKPLFNIQESIEFCGVKKQVLNVGIKNF